MRRKTGFVWNELYMWHDTGHYAGVVQPDPAAFIEPDEHHENPKTKRRFKNLLDATGLIRELELIDAREATEREVLRIHDARYIEQIKALSHNSGGEAGPSTPFGKGGYDIALLSAGGCLALAETVMEGKVANGYALNRPPGHHATRDAAMGFCLLANGAITASALLHDHGLSRVAIVDWDVHHGNGAESIFWEEPGVLTISIHQDNCFPPNSGAVDAVGAGPGEGFNLNVPLPPGSGRGAYLAAFERVVLPALRAYRPQFILVASGFDAAGHDPLGRNMLYSAVYGEMTQMLLELADDLCGGRIMMTHEGGYSPSIVPFCGLRVLEALSGAQANIADPFEFALAHVGYQDLQAHQDAVIARAEENVCAMTARAVQTALPG
jgi:acetoin utilization deacetylase AcuC-like enzyme